MLKHHSVVALIPARGGSKGVPRKNLHPLGGKPLLAWPIETALATPEIDAVYVSTDDAEIADTATRYGAEVMARPPELALDSSRVIDTIRHFIATLQQRGLPCDILVLLEATSPVRPEGLVSRCLQRLVAGDYDSLATFEEASIHPERTWKLTDGQCTPFLDGAVPWKPRQEFTPAYELNGAVYAFWTRRLPETGVSVLFGRMGAEIMPSGTTLDIDTEEDFHYAEYILQKR